MAPQVWEKKARAFAIRAQGHLWGKNNEDPLSFLYLKGLNLKFISKMCMGWNKFGHNRPLKGWGLSGDGSFYIPPGIVFPYMQGKTITGMFIISMENPGSDSIIPGSANGPLVLGRGNREVRKAADLLEGLRIFQEDTDLFCVNIFLPQHDSL